MITLPLWLRRRSGGRSPEAACSFGLLAAYITRPGHGAIARVMGFGAGALLATASIQLTISARLHAGPVTALTFLLTGALVFSCVNAWLAREGGKNRKRCGECVRQENERDHPGNGLAIAIGTMIDAVSEGLVLGIRLRLALHTTWPPQRQSSPASFWPTFPNRCPAQRACASQAAGAPSHRRDSLDRRNREPPKCGVNLVDTHPHLSVTPPEQQPEQPATDELRDRFGRRLGRLACRQHHLDLVPNQIDQ
jgi:hypothetical protein